MSGQLLFAIMKTSPAQLTCSANDRSVLLQLADHFNPAMNGSLVWPSQELLAELTGLGERTVRRSLKALCDLDLIKVHQRTPRCTKYIVNSGLIFRLCEGGQTGQSEPSDRPHRPVMVATQAGQTGHTGRSIETPIETPTETPIPPVGVSSNPKVGSDPVQRQMVLAGIVAGAAERLRIPSDETPTEEKTDWREDRRKAIGSAGGKERPG